MVIGSMTASVWAAAPAAASTAAGGPASPEDIARQTVADALGIAPGGVDLISTAFQEFPDGSLGCPQPGMAYAQVISPGYQILVEAAGRRFDVRVAGTGGRICYRRKARVADDTPSTVRLPARAEAARQDLALRLGMPGAEVSVSGLRALKPGDTLAGCGVVCAPDAAAGACGTHVRLRAGDRDYDYVMVDETVRPCPEIASR
jgi:hypothetical protein